MTTILCNIDSIVVDRATSRKILNSTKSIQHRCKLLKPTNAKLRIKGKHYPIKAICGMGIMPTRAKDDEIMYPLTLDINVEVAISYRTRIKTTYMLLAIGYELPNGENRVMTYADGRFEEIKTEEYRVAGGYYGMYVGQPAELLKLVNLKQDGTSKEYDAWGNIREFKIAKKSPIQGLPSLFNYMLFNLDRHWHYSGDDIIIGTSDSQMTFPSRIKDKLSERLNAFQQISMKTECKLVLLDRTGSAYSCAGGVLEKINTGNALDTFDKMCVFGRLLRRPSMAMFGHDEVNNRWNRIMVNRPIAMEIIDGVPSFYDDIDMESTVVGQWGEHPESKTPTFIVERRPKCIF